MNRILQRNLPILNQSLINNKNRRVYRKSLLWGFINFFLLVALLYDVWYSCPLSISYYQYVEYICTVILLINFVYHVCKVIQTSFHLSNGLIITRNRQKILQTDSQDSQKIINKTVPNISWNSKLSSSPTSESYNYSLSSPSWVYHKGNNSSIDLKNRSTLNHSNFYEHSNTSIDFITDENSLDKYLKEYDDNKKINNTKTLQKTSKNILNSFWSHPITKTAKDMTTFLTKCQYQLSTQSSMKSQNSPGRDDANKSIINQQNAMEVWTRINVNIVALTQWNENLRMWISQTILERLVNEFYRIDDALEKQYFIDIKIGQVGLDRIRKTAQISLLTQSIPSLMTIIPFLEVTTNQTYLVKRIKELAKGGCISEFKWNGGNKEWDDSLPTDSEIIMHLFITYLDTQLMPMPNEPDKKPFSGRHYIKLNEKVPTLQSKSLYIQQTAEKPPHYRVIVGDKMYEMVNGYNNLFHTILFFIYHANKIQNGMLGRINMGRAGINLLWIIDE